MAYARGDKVNGRPAVLVKVSAKASRYKWRWPECFRRSTYIAGTANTVSRPAFLNRIYLPNDPLAVVFSQRGPYRLYRGKCLYFPRLLKRKFNVIVCFIMIYD